jgi:hypothetical protein
VSGPPGGPAGQPGSARSAYWAEPADWDDDYPDEIPSGVYWRRRAVALVIGMAVLSLIAWAVNGVLGGSRAAGQPATRGTSSSAGAHGHSHGHSHSGAKDLSGSVP